jgi:hypothetical protein
LGRQQELASLSSESPSKPVNLGLLMIFFKKKGVRHRGFWIYYQKKLSAAQDLEIARWHARLAPDGAGRGTGALRRCRRRKGCCRDVTAPTGLSKVCLGKHNYFRKWFDAELLKCGRLAWVLYPPGLLENH